MAQDIWNLFAYEVLEYNGWHNHPCILLWILYSFLRLVTCVKLVHITPTKWGNVNHTIRLNCLQILHMPRLLTYCVFVFCIYRVMILDWGDMRTHLCYDFWLLWEDIMPRTYKRKAFADSRWREHSVDCLNKAVSAVIDGTLSSYSASHQYDVPRGTVPRHVAYYKCTGQWPKIGEGRPTYLSHDEEALLVSIIQAQAEAGFPMDKSELRDLIAEYLPNVGEESYFSHGRPGQDWYNNFMHRWRSELSVRKPELLTLSRALACNKAVVDAWFYYNLIFLISLNCQSTI